MPCEAPLMMATRCELLIVRSLSFVDARCNAGSVPADARLLLPVCSLLIGAISHCTTLAGWSCASCATS
jgi:hypothetical protein